MDTWNRSGKGMQERGFLLLMCLVLPVLGGCREADRPIGADDGASIAVFSDPSGGRIVVDRSDTGRRTPDTVAVGPGPREVAVRLDTVGLTYGFSARLEARRNEVATVDGTLLVKCSSESCYRGMVGYHAPNRVRFAVTPTGSLFYVNGAGEGVYWPAGTANSYVSAGAAVFAAVDAATTDRVGTGVYAKRDAFCGVCDYLVGRPLPELENAGGRFRLRQTAWVLPPGSLLLLRTARGIAVEQAVEAQPDVDDVVLIRLTFRNITAEPSYRSMDPLVPEGGTTYESAFIGFALDADVGVSEDDQLSYVPDLDLAFMYDSDFREAAFSGGWSDRPALIGIRLLERPGGTTVMLNGWPRGADWMAGAESERDAWNWLSGTQTVLPNHPDPGIGYAPAAPADLRISVSAGPLRLAPGDTASIAVALVLAEPAPGTFTSGSTMAPGDPLDPSRPLLRTAAPLLERARAAEALLLQP